MKIELHTHTSEGSRCALITAKELIEDYAKENIDVVVITNHYSKNTYERFKNDLKNNYLKGYLEAKKEAQKYGITVLLGMELNLSTHPNDYLIYGIDENFIERHPLIFDLPLEKVCQIVHLENCLIFQAHPCRKPCIIKGADTLDGYEINYSPFHQNNNEQLLKWLKEQEKSYYIICGSDCHGHEGVAKGIFKTSKIVTTQKDLLNALTEKKTRL